MARAAKHIERESKQPRLNPNDSDSAWFIADSDLYRAHLREPRFGVDTREYDNWLIEFAQSEPHLIGLISSVVSKDKNRAWSLTGGARQVKRIGERLRNVEGGAGWRQFMSLQSRAYYNTNMGAVSEVERLDNGNGTSTFLSLYHVDSTRLRLTNNPEFPLRYNPYGARVQNWTADDYFRVVSLPDTREQWRKVGNCAVNRCVKLAKMLIAVYEHDLEALGAEPPRGFAVFDNISREMYRQAVKERQEAKRNGDTGYTTNLLAFFGKIPDQKTDVRIIPYSVLPTNIENLDEFTTLVMYGYSLCFGYDPQEFYPVKSGSFGRGQEALIQSEKASYKGEADFTIDFQEQIQRLLPESVDFQFDRNDPRGDLLRLQVFSEYTALYRSLYDVPNYLETVITRDEFRTKLAEKGIIPPEWTNEEESGTETDLKRLQVLTRDNERVRSAATRYPSEPIIQYRYDPLFNRITRQDVFESGDALLKRVSFASAFSKDPLLERLLHIRGCSCKSCRPNRSDAKAREALEGETLWQDDDDSDIKITTGDVDKAIADAYAVNPSYGELLEAQNEAPERAYVWDGKRYKDSSTGRFVSKATIRLWVNQSIEASFFETDTLAELFSQGAISADLWQEEMREQIKREYISSYMAGRGGREAMTQADWGRVGQMLRVQYAYLDGFKEALETGLLTEGQIKTRASMYIDSANAAYSAGEAVSLGVNPRALPAMPADGTTQCLTRCKCYWDYKEILENGRVVAYLVTWTRTVTDSCDDCIQRAVDWVAIRVAVTL